MMKPSKLNHGTVLNGGQDNGISEDKSEARYSRTFFAQLTRTSCSVCNGTIAAIDYRFQWMTVHLIIAACRDSWDEAMPRKGRARMLLLLLAMTARMKP